MALYPSTTGGTVVDEKAVIHPTPLRQSVAAMKRYD
jgi:hypothetical protein